MSLPLALVVLATTEMLIHPFPGLRHRIAICSSLGKDLLEVLQLARDKNRLSKVQNCGERLIFIQLEIHRNKKKINRCEQKVA